VGDRVLLCKKGVRRKMDPLWSEPRKIKRRYQEETGDMAISPMGLTEVKRASGVVAKISGGIENTYRVQYWGSQTNR
jgi:hypothetical protein